MEVHHHSHSSTATGGTARKKWAHYFWEFLMLFLAVTLGFFVENQREHFIEHKRARILAISLVQDLKKDTASLLATIIRCEHKIENLRNLVIELRQPSGKLNDTLVYKNSLLIQYATRFLRAEGTYKQIVSSGSLRYFRQYLVNLMNQYDIDTRMVEKRVEADLNIIFNNSLTFINKHMNQEVYDEVLENRPITKSLYTKFESPDELNELINYAIVSRRITERMKIECETALASGKELIISLNQEYHLK